VKIAVFHNYYKLRGGEDVMFELECEALEKAGHTVLPYTIENAKELASSSFGNKALVAWRTAHNPVSHRRILEFLKREKPDVGHVHNWFPLFSPSIYKAHAEAGIPVVQTLHNYRLGCAAGNYRRDNQPCNACRPLHSGPAVMHRCYRGSLSGSLAWKRMADRNWKDGTFTDQVDHYIAPSREVARRHEQMGLPADRISVIPNASVGPLDGRNLLSWDKREGVVFLGRLVPEKGAEVLLKAWKQFLSANPAKVPSLKIIGTGPEEARLKREYSHLEGVHFAGQVDRQEVDRQLSSARLLVFPSRWAEPFGLGVIEAMAAGCPVVATKLGGPAELVSHGEDGILVPPDDIGMLADSIHSLTKDPDMFARMGAAARTKFEHHFTAKVHARNLIELFTSLRRST
jgi:glycosyltransferase involved in cell wall biosynthesis